MKGDLDMKAAFFAATMAALSFSGVALADGVDGAWKIARRTYEGDARPSTRA